MKIIASGIDLSNAVSRVVKAISNRTTNPVLEGIKLSVVGDELTLLATDTEISIEKTIKVNTFIEGETVIPGKIFSDFIKKLENEEEIEISLEENRVRISYSSSEGYIQTLNVEEFPLINKDIRENSFTIKQKDFKELILKSSFACSLDEARPILKGCLFEIEDDKISSVALDGFRLAICRKKIENATKNFKIIVTSRTLNEIIRILEKDEDLITVVVQKNVLMVEVEGTVLISRLLEGEYIDYKNIIKDEFVSVVRVNKNQLLSAIDRASIIANDKNKIVKFDIKENYMTVVAESDVGKMSENVVINLEGKDLSIAFNSKFITDCVKAIDDEFINLHFNSRINPCVIKPIGWDDYLYLILPLRINA